MPEVDSHELPMGRTGSPIELSTNVGKEKKTAPVGLQVNNIEKQPNMVEEKAKAKETLPRPKTTIEEALKSKNLPWINGLNNCNVYSQFNNLVNAVTHFNEQFSKAKYQDTFSKISMPFSEILRCIQSPKPPSDVMVATISGVIQTMFEELRMKKNGRQRLGEFSKAILHCQKSLTTFIHTLQTGIRMCEKKHERKLSVSESMHRDWYQGISPQEKPTMVQAFSVLSQLESRHAKYQVQAWLLHQLAMLQVVEEEVGGMSENRLASLVHTDTPEELQQKIDSLANITQVQFSCTVDFFKQTLTRSLARQPLIIIGGIIFMTIAAGYIMNTGAVKFSGFAYDGNEVRVWFPLLVFLSGLGLFLWGWMFGIGGSLAKLAICDYGDGACCGCECAKGCSQV